VRHRVAQNAVQSRSSADDPSTTFPALAAHPPIWRGAPRRCSAPRACAHAERSFGLSVG